MNASPVGSLNTLQGHVDAAVESLAASIPGEQGGKVLDGLVLLGELHDSYPTLLIHDPNLTDSAKILYLYLLQEARSRPRGAALVMPSVQQICEALGHSCRTVVRDRTLLRLGCWISCCRRVRDPSGRFRGDIYALHSEPCPLVDAVQLDDGYMQFLQECAADHYDRSVRLAADGALQLIVSQIGDGIDPLERPDPAARRLRAVESVRNGRGEFFGLVFKQRSRFSSCAESIQFQNLKPEPVSNFETGLQHAVLPVISNFETMISCSSSHNENPTTTDTAARNFEPPQDLRWPPSFDDNMRRLVFAAIHNELADCALYQDIIDALSLQAANPDNPLRNPVGLAVCLCRRANQGRFNRVRPPSVFAERLPARASNTPRESDRNANAVELQGRINSLERLVNHCASENHREMIETQLSDAREQLANLVQGGLGEENASIRH